MGFLGRTSELTYEYEFIIKHTLGNNDTFTLHQQSVVVYDDVDRRGLLNLLNRVNELPDIEVELYELHGRERII